MCAAMGKNWYVDPCVCVCGHTHHGGAMPLEPAFWVYNTGGWLKNTKDRPPLTHLFGITAEGRVKMTRADFG